MKRSAFRAIAGALLASACAEGAVHLTPPGGTSGVGSSLLVAEPNDGRPLIVFASDGAPSARAVELELERPIDHTLTMFTFPRSLAELGGLVAGVITLPAEGVSRRPIRGWSSAYRASLEDTGASPWDETAELSTRVRQVRLPEAAPAPEDCVLFRHRGLEIVDFPTAILPLDDHTALVTTSSGGYYRVTIDEIENLPSLSAAPIEGGFVDPNGTLWLTARDGTILELGPDLSERSRFVATGTIPKVIDDIVGRSSPLEMHAVTRRGRLYQLKDRVWRVVELQRGGTPAVELLPSGEVMVGAAMTLEQRSVNGDSTPEPFPASNGLISSITEVPGVGRFVTTTLGHQTLVYEYDASSSSWDFRHQVQVGNDGYALLDSAPLNDGFLFGSALGYLGQYVHDRGFCPETAIGASLPGRSVTWGWNSVVPVGTGFILMGGEVLDAGEFGSRGLAWLVRD